MRAVQEGNASKRRQAKNANKTSYSQMFVDFRPACVECDQPIRRDHGIRSMHAHCGCEGVKWALNTSSIITGTWSRQ